VFRGDQLLFHGGGGGLMLLPPSDGWLAWFPEFGDFELYVDIVVGATRSESSVTMIDLDLDVVRHRGGAVELLDVDEFEAHQIELGHPADVVEHASSSCEAGWVRAVGWRGGNADERSPAGYGIKITPADRDRHFDPNWTSVVLELADGPTIEVPLTDSFWRSCSELRSAQLGRWLLVAGRALWPKHAPPGIAVNRIADNRFSARILEHRSLL
jgi:hypothetical protein